MTVIPFQPRGATAAGTSVFLRLDDQMLTAGQVVLALASYLIEFGDNFHGEVDPSMPSLPRSATAISTAGRKPPHPTTRQRC
jgi:hypothetical protein